MDFYRTGQTSKYRICPKHNSDLELCINDKDYSKWALVFHPLSNNQDNRVAWRCEECLGYWFENHFIDQAESNRPYRIECAHLVLNCPDCDSSRVTHTCVPECCGAHQCLDCEAAFEAVTKLVRAGVDKTDDSPRLRGQGWTASGPLKPHMHRTGIEREYRSCDQEEHGKLELVLIDPVGICDAQVGWYCKTCQRVHYEVGGQRSIRLGFEPEARALALCPHCHSQYLNSTDEESGHCQCVECGAEVIVTLEPSNSS